MDIEWSKIAYAAFAGVAGFIIARYDKIKTDVNQLEKDMNVLHEWKRLMEKRLEGDKK